MKDSFVQISKSFIAFIKYQQLMKQTGNKTAEVQTKIETQSNDILLYELPTEKIEKERTKIGFGEWNKKQVFKYFLFVFHHKHKFSNKSSRKSNRIFKRMTKFIRSRSSSQCRTHHQNVVRKYLTIQKALQIYIEETPLFYQKYRLIKSTLQVLEDNQFLGSASPQNSALKNTVVPVQKEEKREKQVSQPSSSAEFSAEESSLMKISADYLQYYRAMRSQKIMECQFLFEEWLRKVNQLMTQWP